MAIAEGKKRITITLSLDQIEALQKLVENYQKDSFGRVTASDVIDDLITKKIVTVDDKQ